jgi:hypothetical protein
MMRERALKVVHRSLIAFAAWSSFAHAAVT